MDAYWAALNYEISGDQIMAYVKFMQAETQFKTISESLWANGSIKIIIEEYIKTIREKLAVHQQALEVRYGLNWKQTNFCSDVKVTLQHMFGAYKNALENYRSICESIMKLKLEQKNELEGNNLLSRKLDLTTYNCSVCLEVPTTKIFQCKEGHLLCNECSVNPAVEIKCPVCRTRYQKTNGKIRNRALEQLISKIKEDENSHKSIISNATPVPKQSDLLDYISKEYEEIRHKKVFIQHIQSIQSV